MRRKREETAEMYHPLNSAAWALGVAGPNGFYIRRVVWGLTMARADKRPAEEIRACTVLVARNSHARKPNKKKDGH